MAVTGQLRQNGSLKCRTLGSYSGVDQLEVPKAALPVSRLPIEVLLYQRDGFQSGQHSKRQTLLKRKKEGMPNLPPNVDARKLHECTVEFP